MPVDPREYDVGELRQLAGDDEDGDEAASPYRRERVRGGDATPRRPAASRSLRSAQSRELRRLDARGKPYLRSLPASYAAEFLVVEWLEFLLAKGGTRGARSALTYYERVGWIEGSVADGLRAYLPGIDADEGAGRLDRDDHRLSLIYVGRLAELSG